jgi:Kef-type K+ transport system membrane component KefB
VDRLLPRTGVPAVLYFAGVVVLLNIGQLMPRRWALLTLAIAALGAGSWCALNFWRCRHAHCVVTGTGWLALGAFTLVEAGMGRSLISGDEGVAFLAVLAAGLVFECAWRASRGSNAITARFPGSAGTTR